MGGQGVDVLKTLFYAKNERKTDMNNLQTKLYPSLQGFGGINTGAAPFNIKDTEATDMLNISSENFPALSQSKAPGAVMQGMDSVKFLGLLYDKSIFCIGTKDGTQGIYYYSGDTWNSISITAAIRALLAGDRFTATNYRDSAGQCTIISTGTNLIKIKGTPPYTATKINAANAMPTRIDFVAAKDDRLICADTLSDQIAISELALIKWEDPIDYWFAKAETNNGETTSALSLYGDMILWFKKSVTTIIYGKAPNSYVWDIMTRSVGCIENKTIAETNIAIMWLSKDGVYAYSATTLPYKISEPIKKYIQGFSGEAAAASDGKRYYLSLQQTDGSYVLCVYDTENKLWDIEENAGYKMFLRTEDGVYASDGAKIYKLGAEDFCGYWYFVTKPFDFGGAAGKANLHRLNLSVRAKAGTAVDISISPDIDGDFFINVHRETFLNDFDGKIPIYLRPDANFRSMNYFRIKLAGTRQCTIYALETEMRIRRGTY